MNAPRSRPTSNSTRRYKAGVFIWQLSIGLGVFFAWEALTRIPWFVENTIFDPFFISRPSLIAKRLFEWVQFGPQSVWPHLWLPLQATVDRKSTRLNSSHVTI